MKIVLLRHGSRLMTAFGDASLSGAGQRQAARLVQPGPAHRGLPAPTRLFCSPKTRAKETLTPLSIARGIPLTIDERFDERLDKETTASFYARTREVLEELARTLQPDDCAYVCSHLDWLEIALRLLPTDLRDDVDPANWSNCEYRVFDVSQGLWAAVANGIVMPD